MRTRWLLSVVGCFLAVSLSGYELAAYASALPDLGRDAVLGLTKTEAGIVASAAMVGMLIGGLGSAGGGRRHRPSTVLRTAVAVMGVGFLTCAFAAEPWALGAGRLVTGVGAGAAVPTAIAITATVAPGHRRTAVHTVMFSGLQLGSALGALVAPEVLDQSSWQALFGIGAGAAFCLVALLPLLTRHDAGLPASPTLTSVRALWTGSNRRLTAAHWSSTALGLGVVYGLNAWLVQLMLGNGHGSAGSLRMFAVFNVGAVLGTPLAGLAADRWGPQRTTVTLFVGGAVSLAVLAEDPSPIATLALLWLAGLGTMGATTILNGFTAAAYGADLRATALGWALGIGRLGAVAGPLYGGLLLDTGATPGTVLIAFAAPALATAGLVATSSPVNPLPNGQALTPPPTPTSGGRRMIHDGPRR